MKQDLYKDKILLELFRQKEEIPESEALKKQIMQKVYKSRKRKELANFCMVGVTSCIMLTGVVVMLKYYLKVDFSMLFQGFIKKPDNFLLPDLLPALFISLIVCSLLWIDHYIRKKWLRA